MKRRTYQHLLRLIFTTIALAFIFSVAIYPQNSYLAALSFIHPIPRPSPQATSSPITVDGYIKRTFTNDQGISLTYYLYVPKNYDPQKKYPLVLVLHGGGERSKPTNTVAQNEAVLLNQTYVQVWTGDYARADNPYIQQHWPCFVVVPQIAISQQWVDTPVHQGSYTQKSQPTTVLLMSMLVLEVVEEEYTGIDAHRRYITGISSGGYGVWDAIERWSGYFAAAIPIAGAGDPSKASVLKNLPIWAFHSVQDPIVPVTGSRDMIAALKSAGGNPRYTEILNTGHAIWSNVYMLPGTTDHIAGVYNWLFAQRR